MPSNSTLHSANLKKRRSAGRARAATQRIQNFSVASFIA
jgi:hypothetical protein